MAAPMGVLMSYRVTALVLSLSLGCAAAFADVVRPAEGPGKGDGTRANEDPETASGADTASTSKPPAPGPKVGYAFNAFPFVFSTPETGFAGGAGLLLLHRRIEDGPADPPQTAGLFAVYTEKRQAELSFSPDLYFAGHVWRLQTYFAYSKFPTSFYGIGNATPDDAEEDYTYEGGVVEGIIARRARESLRVGLEFEVKGRAISGETPGGSIDRGAVDGADGGLYAGLGPAVEWDSRNSIFFPTRGSWVRSSIVFHGSGTGSDATYDTWIADARRYHPLGSSHVIATQLVVAGRTGSTPFHELAQVGRYERGIYQGRLTDRAMGFVQVEDRFPIWWRLAGAVFAAAGDVCDGLERYRLADTKLAAGGGLRYIMNRDERIHLRADIGVSRYGGQVYFQFQEAF